MAWIQAHQELRDHPKMKRAARQLGMCQAEMVGHLMMLWWWALDHAADGDLSRFDAEDIADAAGVDVDADRFVEVLVGCGPGDRAGFLDVDMVLHDWEEYGGRYRRRSESGQKAAQARWNGKPDANAMRSQCDGNAEERRGEEKRKTVVALFDDWWSRYPRGKAGKPGGDGARKPAETKWLRLSSKQQALCMSAVDNYRAHVESDGGPIAAHAVTWLNQERWDQWQEAAVMSREDRLKRSIGTGGVA